MTVHGGIDDDECARLGIDPTTVVDFSVNSNPYGPAPGVWVAARAADIARYPDRNCTALRAALTAHDTAAECGEVIFGNGAAELIWAVARAFLDPGDTAMIVGPTYGDYAAACAACRARVREVRVVKNRSAQNSARVDEDIRQERPRLVWLCNPNNPTGAWLASLHLTPLIDACAAVGARLVVDESYRHFLFPPPSASEIATERLLDLSHTILLRSLTKEYALMGVRLGYLVTDSANAARIAEQIPSWNVGASAQAAGAAALSDRNHMQRTLAMLARERDAFFAALRKVGFPIFSQTHFGLVKVGDAALVQQHMLMRGLLVRDCASFRLPAYIRVATRPEWPQLVDALCDVCPNAALRSPSPVGKGRGG